METGFIRIRSWSPFVLSALPLLFVVLMILQACSAAVTLPEDPIEEPGLLIELLTNRSRPSSFFVYGRAEYYSADAVRKGKLMVMAQGRDSLRIEAMTPTDDMLSLLATSNGGFTYFERGSKTCYRGETCFENIRRFLPLPLEVHQVVGLFSGNPPLLAASSSSLELDKKTGLYLLTLKNDQGIVERLEVDPFSFQVSKVSISGPGTPRVVLNLEEYKPAGSFTIPHRIRARVNKDEMDLSIEIREADTNTEFKGDPFSAACPGGSTLEELPCPAPETKP